MEPISECPVLVATNGILEGQRWSLTGPMTIGRDGSCDIVIPDRQVSRYHARITPGKELASMEDLGSKNGTYYRGRMIEERQDLQDGDTFQVALVQEFMFLTSDATMPMVGMPIGAAERHGKLFLDPRSRRVWVGKDEVLPPLSAPQFRLLQMLYEQTGKVVSREDLVNRIWGAEEAIGVSEQALDALIRRLRERLESMDPNNAYILTVRGHGLRLENPDW